MDCSPNKSYIQRKRWKKWMLILLIKTVKYLAIYDVEQYL